MHQNHTRFRGVSRVRSEGPNAATLMAELQSAFTSFKAQHGDKVTTIETALNNVMADIATMKVGGGGGTAPGGMASSGLMLNAQAASEFLAQLRGNPQAARYGTTQSDPDGGYMVPEQVDGVILNLLRTLSPLRQWATVAQVGSASWKKIIQQTGTGSGWVGEEEDRANTDFPQFRIAEIPTHELYANPSVTNVLLDDSDFDLNAFLSDDVATEFAVKEGGAFVNGDGMRKPRGFLTYDMTNEADAVRDPAKFQYVATGQSGAFPSSNPADTLVDLVTPLRPIYRSGPGVGWIMNSATAATIRKFKDGQGRFIWTDALIEGQPSVLLGYPVAIDENMPDITAGSLSVAFGNWRRGYCITDRMGLRMLNDPYTRKGWTNFYFTKRVGGGALDFKALKFLKFSAS